MKRYKIFVIYRPLGCIVRLPFIVHISLSTQLRALTFSLNRHLAGYKGFSDGSML